MAKKVQLKVPAPKPEAADGKATGAASVSGKEGAQAASGLRAGSAADAGWLGDLVAAGLGVLIWGVAAIVEPGIRDLFQWPKQKLLATGAALLTGLAGALWFAGVRWRWNRSPLLWPVVVLLGSMLLSLQVAPSQTGGILSIFARYDAHRWLAAGALFVVTATVLSTPRRLWFLLGGMTLGGLAVARTGIGEHHDIQAFLPPPDKRWAIISKPGSTFGNRNMAAELMIATIPACYAALAMAVRWWNHGKASRALALAVPAGLFLAFELYYLKLTVTRSAFIGTALGLLVAGLAWVLGRIVAERRLDREASAREADAPVQADSPPPTARRSKLAPLLVALAIGGVGVSGASYMLVKFGFSTPIDEGDAKRARGFVDLAKSSFDTKSDAAQWRFGMWASTWEAIKANPLGLGAGNWRVIYPQYLTQREKNEMFSIAKQPIRAHQDFLQIGAEWGVQGLAALLALLGMAMWLTVRTAAHYLRREQDDPDGAALYTYSAMAALAGIIALCGDALFSFPLALPAPTMMLCILLGIIAAAEAKVSGRKPLELPAWTGGAVLGAGVAGLVFLQGFGGYVGLHERWDTAEKGFTEGRALQKRGRASEGLAAIRKAIAINPDDFQNHFIEALCLNSLGQTKEAIQSLHRSLALYPNLLNAWVNVAMFSLKAGDEAGMDAAIDKALALKPDELVALNTRANYWNARGRHEDVLKLLEPQYVGYVQFRDSGRWPDDDNGQLQGAFKTMLQHLITAAKKLGKHDVHAKYLIALNDIPIPNDGRSEDAKRTERRDRAQAIAEALLAASNAKDALPWAKLAAELAGQTHPELKTLYALTAARNGDDKTCAHESQVAIAMDGTQKPKLEEGLQAIDAPAAKACKDVVTATPIAP